MNRKFLITFSMTSALLTATYPCLAMEQEDKGKNYIKVGFDNSNEFITTLSMVSLKQYKATCKMQDSLEQAKSFGEIAKLLELNMPEILIINDALSTETFIQLRACSLRQQGVVLNNITQGLPHPGTPMEKRVALLKDAADVMRKSYQGYKSLKTPENQKEASISLNYLGPIFFQLGLGYSLCAESEKDSYKIIDRHLTALSLGKESYCINQTLGQEDQIKRQLMLALRQGFVVYNSIASNIDFFKELDTPAKYAALTQNINLLEKILSLFTNHLLDASIKIDWCLENNFKSKKKYSKPQSQELFSISPSTLKKLPPALAPEDCMRLFWGTYCGILNSASHTVSNLVGVNDQITALYKVKAKEHLDLARKTYREKIYQGEYKNNPVKEEEFIVARLGSLAENEKPLMDFYATLRQEKKRALRKSHSSNDSG